MSLSDLNHYIGGDLAATAGGDLAPIDGTTRGQQRVLRRLLTNPGEYIFHPEYGAGLPQWIGRIADLAQMSGLIRGQMLLEDVVAKSPEPVVDVRPIPRTSGGGFAVSITYTDAATGKAETLSFDVTE